jgi:cyclase
VPLTVIGGAGKLDDFKKLFKKFNLIGAAAGSYFVFKGIYKAVLINYISKEDKLKLFKNTYV